MRADEFTAMDELLFVARRVIQMVQDPRSDAPRLARLLDMVPPLADSVVEQAEVLYRDRGRVLSTTHAVTLIGFDRLERVVRRSVRREYARLQSLVSDGALDGASARRAPLPAHLTPVRYAAV